MFIPVRYRMAMADRNTLTRDAWCDAALEQIAAGGTPSLSVEGLARRLGVTKGSFYWHFTNRADLVASALSYWAQVATAQIIEELSGIENPAERLSALFTSAFGDERTSLDVKLATTHDDPAVADAVRRVTESRLRFVTEAFTQMGLDHPTAQRRALIVYGAYLGHFQLADALGNDPAADQLGQPYFNQLLSALLPSG